MPLVEEPYTKINPKNLPKVLVIELDNSDEGLKDD